jgi:hypothetical protein
MAKMLQNGDDQHQPRETGSDGATTSLHSESRRTRSEIAPQPQQEAHSDSQEHRADSRRGRLEPVAMEDAELSRRGDLCSGTGGGVASGGGGGELGLSELVVVAGGMGDCD